MLSYYNLLYDKSYVIQEYKKERIALERKYLELKIPFYETRRQVVIGELDPPAPEEVSGFNITPLMNNNPLQKRFLNLEMKQNQRW